jgi:Zn-dependent protease/CBS domain-containing protein
MFRSLRIGSLAGIDIFVHWTFLLLLGFFLVSGLASGQGLAASLAGVVFVVVLFGCVVLHELGHALAARRYGIPTRDITLLPIGGVARLERIPKKPSEELVVALAGPAVNVVIAAALAALLGPLTGWNGLLQGDSFLHNLLRVNLLLVAFNMLPAFPMDGGRVLRALLATRLDHVHATDIAAGVGRMMAVLFGLVGILVLANPMLVLLAVFVYMSAGAEARQARQGEPAPLSDGEGVMGDRLGSGRIADVMIRRVRAVPAYLRLDAIPDELFDGSQRDFPVVEEGRIVGILRRVDLLGALPASGHWRVADLMRRDFPLAEANEPLPAALARLASSGQDCMPVVQQGHLVGLVQLRDGRPARQGPAGFRGEGRVAAEQIPAEIG